MRLNITISIEDSVLEVFDLQRGEKSRGDFIEELVKGWRGSETKLGGFSTEVSISASKPEDTGSSPVAPAKKSSEPVKSSTPEFRTYFKKDGKQK